MALLKRVLRIAAAATAGATYLWFAGVRYAPLAKWRRRAKAAARRRAA